MTRHIRVALLIGPLVFLHASVAGAQADGRDHCTVIISGAQAPELVPAQDVWETVFLRVATEPRDKSTLRLSAGGYQRLSEIGSSVMKRLADLREQSRADGNVYTQRNRNIAAAAMIREARDEALRALSPTEFAETDAYVIELSRQMNVPLSTGVAPARTGAIAKCEVEINGRDNPHLIPEWKPWQEYFQLWAIGARRNRVADGQFDPRYLKVLGRSIGISPEDADALLRQADDAATAIDKVTAASANSPGGAGPLNLEIRRVVMQFRHAALRSLTDDGWHALVQHIDRSSDGFTWWYR